MRRPKTPPAASALAAARREHPLDVMIAHASATDDMGRYLHWDELSHRPPPKGLSHVGWWAAIKAARAIQAQALPLTGSSQQALRFCETPQMRSSLHWIDGEARGQIKADEAVATRETADFYVVRSLIEEPYSSSVLEGAATTRRIAKEMIEGDRKPRTVGERMVLNNYHAMRLIREMKDQPLTQAMILTIHAALTHDTLDTPKHAGQFRTDRDHVVVEDQATGDVLHVPPPAGELPARLQRICDFANQVNDGGAFIHPIVRAMILHFMIGFDHPFVDGNGRTARALFYWCALRNGYWLLEFASISKAIREAPTRYGLAYLHSETDDGDLTYFLIYHIEVVVKAIRSLHAYLERKAEELKQLDRAVRKRMGTKRRFNARQIQILQEAIRRPGHHLTIGAHRERAGISYLTARADLESLANEGFLRKRTVDGQSVYFADAKIVEKLTPDAK
jgi:Fic family protein